MNHSPPGVISSIHRNLVVDPRQSMPSTHKDVAFALAHSMVQPRVGRRIEQLSAIFGYQKVFGYERKLYAGAFKIDASRVDVVLLGDVGKGISVGRVVKLFRGAVRVICGLIYERPIFIYCFSLDLALVGLCGKLFGVRLGYEISDLHFSREHAGWLNSLGVCLEDIVIRNSDVVVSTSPYFDKDLCLRVEKFATKRCVIENGLTGDYMAQIERPSPIRCWPLEKRPICLGVIGALKYVDVLLRFLKAVDTIGGRFVCNVYGDGFWRDQVIEVCAASKYLNYYGPYRNPEDLAKIYSAVDMVVSVYDGEDPNVRLALPNKLYEAVYFNKPLVVTSGTALAERVLEWGVGFAIDSGSERGMEMFLENVEVREIVDKSAQCTRIPNEFLMSNPTEFLNFLRSRMSEFENQAVV